MRSFKASSRLEISRFLSRLEARDAKALKCLEKIFHERSLEKTICVTGAAGVGKSTFLSTYIEVFSAQEKIAWLACDPTSLVSGGGLLGDRIRLNDLARDKMNPRQVFVRSLATRSEMPYSVAVRDMALFLESFFDRVFIETAGIGQTQWSVAHLAPVTVLLVQPETGDEIQSMKAGVQEMADMLVVHKADLPTATRFSSDIRDTFGRTKAVLDISSVNKSGFEAFREELQRLENSKAFVQRLEALHKEHARDLALEFQRRKLDRSFDRLWKKSKGNPYAVSRGV